MKKKLLSIALVLMLLLSLVPSMALADDLYVSVGGYAFTGYNQTISVGGGTATLKKSGPYPALELNNVKLTSFDELTDAEGNVYKCGIIVMSNKQFIIEANGYNSITAPNDKSDAIYEGIYSDAKDLSFQYNSTLDFSGLDIGIESVNTQGVNLSGSKLNFYNCDMSVSTANRLYVSASSTINISGSGSFGINAESIFVQDGSKLNIKLYGEGQPARYGIYATSAEILGTANVDVSIKNVAEQQDVVANAVCVLNSLSVGNYSAPGLKASVTAENCPAATAVAVAAGGLINHGSPQTGYYGKGTVDAKVSVSGGHLLARAVSCNSMTLGATLKAQVTGASADDVAVEVASNFNIGDPNGSPSLYASIDAQNSNYGAVILPKMDASDTDTAPNQYGTLILTQPSNVQFKDISEDGVTYQIAADENGAPVNCVYGNVKGYKFTDITTLNDSYKVAIAWASDTGVTGGYSDFTFRPQNTCTRAQVVTFIWRANGNPEPAGTAAGFNDVPESAYYYKAVLWAAEQGITSGFDDGGFHPDETVTRAQAMTFIWRAENKPAAPDGTVNEFVDVSEANYYYDAVLWAVANGITGGYNNTLFGSNDGCTRAQIVTFLHRNMA